MSALLGQGLLIIRLVSLPQRDRPRIWTRDIPRSSISKLLTRVFECYSGTADPEQENSFRFTPIKALRALPRLWERKPSTPFRAGAGQKPKKLWKRIQAPFSSMKTLQQTDGFENDAFQTAINASKDAAYVRGVKRLCVGSGESEDLVQTQEPGRSFLETKWESEASRKRRKYCVKAE